MTYNKRSPNSARGRQPQRPARTPGKKAPAKAFRTRTPQPVVTAAPTFPMRINKFLALKKQSTRRGADELIEKRQVFINGRLAVLGDKVNENDNVEVRFRGNQKPPEYVYYAYNKPSGIPTDLIQSGKNTEHAVPIRNVFPTGHLDKDAHGLVLLTNDGRLTDRLLSPRYTYEREYVVTTKEPLRNNFKTKMEAGVKIEDGMTRPCKVKVIDDTTFRIVLTEDKKHQIRRMCVALFQEVDDLQRTRIMNIELGKLAEGSYRKIEGEELHAFLESMELV